MRYTVIFWVTVMFFTSSIVAAQDSSVNFSPKLLLEFSLIDFPYLKQAAQSFANHRQGHGMDCRCSKNAGDYLESYSSPSMLQSVQMSKNLYGTVGYFLEKGSQSIFKPHTSVSRKILSRVSGEVASFITTGFLMPLPFSQVWVHEEFHRNILSRRHIYSVDELWEFKGGDYIKVSGVLDDDLVLFKKRFPHEHIRMSAAGIEGELQFVRSYQMDHFFSELNTPISGPYTLGVLGAIGYIYSTKDWNDINETLNKMNAEENNILDRDFTGHDIASWVYDLFNPSEPFQGRGLHSSGTGIDRYINPLHDFTPEMTAYVDKMSKRSFLNLISPSVLGIRKIRVNKNLSLNFALRHTLTSFGDDRQADLFLISRWGKFAATLHKYSNQNRSFAGLELQIRDKTIILFNNDITVDGRIMYWNQPQNLLFKDVYGSAGGGAEVRVAPELGKIYRPYAEIETKTKGWLAGNPYQDRNFSLRLGLSFFVGER